MLRILLSMLLLLLPLGSALAVEKESGGIFCYDQGELDSWRKGLSPATRKLFLDGPTVGPILKTYENALAAAENGDVKSQDLIAGWWAACLLDGARFNEQKLANTLRYVQASAHRGDQAKTRYLAMFTALGWGVPQSYTESYRLISASGFPVDAKALAARLHVSKVSVSEQEAFLVASEAIKVLLRGRISDLIPQMVKPGSANTMLNVRVAHRLCQGEVSLLDPVPDEIDREGTIEAIKSIVSLLPTTGLPCMDDDGKPLTVAYPLTIQPGLGRTK